jgi:glucose/arabinose dehydrogenase
MSKRRQIILVIFTILAVVVVTFAVYLLRKDNSSNQTRSEQTVETPKDFLNLVEKTVIVPEQFKKGTFATPQTLNLPANFKVSVFASDLGAPRHFDFDENNNIYVGEPKNGRVLILSDKDQDGVSDNIVVIDTNLRTPHGIDYYKGDLYVGEENQVDVYRGIAPDGKFTKKEILVPNLPEGGHLTRSVLVGPDEKLYVSIGSTCNICDETEVRRATVMQYNLDGSNGHIFASGLRNSVGLAFRGDEFWSVDNGRDRLEDDLPPEEVNILKEGQHYGWPFCYGKGITNPEYLGQKEDFCLKSSYPKYEMQAHSAPLDLAFSPNSFPEALKNELFITFHGSWNRTIPTGYKIVRLDTNNESSQAVDFINGWMDKSNNVWGRPVGIKFNQEKMYISDDLSGTMYVVEYER